MSSDLPVHPYDSVRVCCAFSADSPVHDTTRGLELKPAPAKRVSARALRRLAELARQVRDPSNSAPLAELLDLVEEVAGHG